VVLEGAASERGADACGDEEILVGDGEAVQGTDLRPAARAASAASAAARAASGTQVTTALT
jgi:hypothetical protein